MPVSPPYIILLSLAWCQGKIECHLRPSAKKVNIQGRCCLVLLSLIHRLPSPPWSCLLMGPGLPMRAVQACLESGIMQDVSDRAKGGEWRRRNQFERKNCIESQISHLEPVSNQPLKNKDLLKVDIDAFSKHGQTNTCLKQFVYPSWLLQGTIQLDPKAYPLSQL